VSIFRTETNVTVELGDLTEEERRQLLELCFKIGMRQMLDAGEIEMDGDGMVSLTEKGRSIANGN
jgi:hypothetical protein